MISFELHVDTGEMLSELYDTRYIGLLQLAMLLLQTTITAHSVQLQSQ